jgi:hypothetical protein
MSGCPPSGCINAATNLPPFKDTLLLLKTYNNYYQLSSQPITSTTPNTVVPLFTSTTSSYDISPIPAITLFFESLTLRLRLLVNASNSTLAPTPSDFSGFKVATFYNSSKGTYGPLQFVPELQVATNLVDSWGFTSVIASGTTYWLIHPAPLVCTNPSSGVKVYCTDNKVALQRDSATGQAVFTTNLVTLTIVSTTTNNFNGTNQVGDSNIQRNRQTSNALLVLQYTRGLT